MFPNDVTSYLINKLTPTNRVLLEKLVCTQLFKKLSAFYGTRKFITVCIGALRLSICWTRLVQYTTRFITYLRCTWILSFHIHLDFQVASFPRGIPTKTVHETLLFPTCHIPAYPILFDLVTRIIFGEKYR